MTHRYNSRMQTSGNIYAFTRNQVMETHANRIEGNHAGVVLVVYTEALEPVAKDALQKSFDAIGYGKAACTFADVSGMDEREAFDLIEGIDPLALVAADEAAAALCAQASRQAFPLQRKMRLCGREARAFKRLNAMFETEADRQTLWHLLKSM